ncbi:MAG: T9SS type A sorting domain-containing protein [Saprospiraceae bacterium]|nr:T9SS type A sorting domain-containing protein [Saprospiraceae bacterium]
MKTLRIFCLLAIFSIPGILAAQNDLAIHITGNVSPQLGLMCNEFTWTAETSGGDGSPATVEVLIINPFDSITNVFEMNPIQGMPGQFTFTESLQIIGTYRTRFKVTQSGQATFYPDNTQSAIAYPVVTQQDAFYQVDFELNKNITSRLFWPFYSCNDTITSNPFSSWNDRQSWINGNEDGIGRGGNGHGEGGHVGQDFYALDWYSDEPCNKTFYAPIEGNIVCESHNCAPDCGFSSPCNGYANQVLIRSSLDSNFIFRVAHLNFTYVERGDYVKVGDPIGAVGSTGLSRGAHAHCVLYKNVDSELLGENGYFSENCNIINFDNPIVKFQSTPFTFDATRFKNELTVGINHKNKSSEKLISVFPNPAQDAVWIEFPEIQPQTTIQIIDMMGRIILAQQISEPVSKIDLTNINKGLYSLKIDAYSTIITKKLLVY